MSKDRKSRKDLTSGVSRRSFIKGAGIAGAAAGAASIFGNFTGNSANAATGIKTDSIYESILGPDAGRIYARKAKCPGPLGIISYEDRTVPPSEISSEENCDIVVVGGGITGITASLKACQLGQKVICLEKMDTARAVFERVASMGSRVLDKALGENFFNDTFKMEFAKSLYAVADYRNRSEVVQTFINRSAEAADFVEDMLNKGTAGMKLVAMMDPAQPQEAFFSLPYMNPLDKEHPVPSGRPAIYAVRELTYVAKNSYKDFFELKTSTPAVQLIREGDGPVTGVIAKRDGKYIRINARKGVILATGAYDANPYLMEAWCRSEDYATTSWWNPCWGVTGDGHMMGLKVGAAMDPMPHTVMNFTGGRATGFNGITGFRFMIGNGAIMVKPDGKRFADETLSLQYLSNALNAQANYGKGVWTIVGNPKPTAALGSSTIDELLLKPLDVENGWAVKADSVAELAEKCGINPEGLQATIDKCNKIPAGKPDLEFGRTRPFGVAKPPYYAVQLRSIILTTVSGLIVNGDCNVLDVNDKPIEGLYAGGNCSGGFFAGNYPRHVSGVSIGRAITFGYVAAENASKRG